jgi:hypothetical protein
LEPGTEKLLVAVQNYGRFWLQFDGDAFWRDYAKPGVKYIVGGCDPRMQRNFWRDYAKPGVKYIVGGCDPRMQRKMYKDALGEVGVRFEEAIVSSPELPGYILTPSA